MKRILFLIVYAIGLCYIWPGLLMGKCSACYPFPPLWLNVVILLGCILVFAAAIYVAALLFRFWGFDKPQPDSDWRKSRPGTYLLPGELPPVPPAKTTHQSIFRVFTAFLVVLILFDFHPYGKQALSACLKNGHFLSANCISLFVRARDSQDLIIFCNNNPAQFRNQEEQTAVVTYMLENGWNPNERGVFGDMPVESCLDKSNRHLLPLLLQHGARLDYAPRFELPPAHIAVNEGNPEFLRYLLENGADAHVCASVFHDNRLALHHACMAGETECVRILLLAGAEVNPLDAAGYTPLDLVNDPDSETSRLMREHGGLCAAELPISLKVDENNLTQKLQAANPEAGDADLVGIIEHKGGRIPYSYHHTGKGNAFIEVPGASIRCYDSHDDGTIYDGFWAQISVQDVNHDQQPDLIVTYTVCSTDDTGRITERHHVRKVYICHESGRCFLPRTN
ncbi:MAG: ankyrin repeat domain-containing protein [Akkermansia sp.]|nr:ankyrin repeat domain-containing protein [Akkermansia sp.]